MKVMFVCTGNICRSAMAHKMLEKRAKEESKDIEVYSCGVNAYDGEHSTGDAIKVMEEYGANLKDHIATNIEKTDIEKMDIILCATTAHKINVVSRYPNVGQKTYTIKEYAGYDKNDLDIKDPWGYDIETYRRCADEINKCLEKIIEKI